MSHLDHMVQIKALVSDLRHPRSTATYDLASAMQWLDSMLIPGWCSVLVTTDLFTDFVSHALCTNKLEMELDIGKYLHGAVGLMNGCPVYTTSVLDKEVPSGVYVVDGAYNVTRMEIR